MNNNHKNNDVLGKSISYLSHYSPSILVGLPREKISKNSGNDIWNAFEFSWLSSEGKPEQRILQLIVPSNSPNIVESKSLKLYLYGFSEMKHHSDSDVLRLIQTDLETIIKYPISVQFHHALPFIDFTGQCLDSLIPLGIYNEPRPNVLEVKQPIISESCYTHLFKSHCPVTNQPDWASIWITYTGPEIDHASLLTYFLSYRVHQGFHESCIESIFNDILLECKCDTLTVYGGFTRRGGIDINPYRSTEKTIALPYMRTNRQ